MYLLALWLQASYTNQLSEILIARGLESQMLLPVVSLELLCIYRGRVLIVE